MIAPPRPPSHDELEALIREARARQLRRRLLGAAGVAIAAALGLSVHALIAGGDISGVTPANAGHASAPLCRSSQLSGSTFFQGATGTLLGGVTILNTSNVACALPSRRPPTSIDWRGKRLPTREATFAAPGIFRPVRLLSPGAKASVLWQWFSCGGNGPKAAVRPTLILRFGHGLIVTARSNEATPAFCGGLGGSRRLLLVSGAVIEN